MCLAGLLLLGGALAACARKPERFVLARVAVAPQALVAAAPLGLDRAALEVRLAAALSAGGRLALPGAEEARRHEGWRATLDLPRVELAAHARAGPQARVGAVLLLQGGLDGAVTYELEGQGEAPATPETGRAAFQRALARALDEVAALAVLQLEADGRPDDALVQTLGAGDARARACALRVLAARRHPAAVPPLLAQLRSQDPAEARRALGALVELHAGAAVPVLIDLARGQDLPQLQELVFALGELGGEEAEAYLYTVAQGHDQPLIQDAARQALESMRAARKLRQEARGTAPRADTP